LAASSPRSTFVAVAVGTARDTACTDPVYSPSQPAPRPSMPGRSDGRRFFGESGPILIPGLLTAFATGLA
jgi:hypothetical protein